MEAGKTSPWKEGTLLSLITVVFIAILIGAALIIHRFPWRIDLSEGRRNSISAQSQKIAKNIRQDIWIRAFFQEGHPGKKKAQALLDTYGYTNPRIRYQFIDPDRQPAVAQQFGIRTYGTLVLETQGKTQMVNTADEEGITTGLLRLLQSKAKKVTFVSGHGEKSIQEMERTGYSLAKGVLEKENYQVGESTLISGGIPSETRCLVVAGPKKPFFPEELDDLKKYLGNGGRLILLLEPYQDGGFKDWLKNVGITLSSDIVVDKVSRLFGGDYLIPMAGSYGQHPITQKFKVATFFPTARSLTPATPPPPDIQIDVLVRSSPGSWAEMNKAKLEKGEAAFEAGQDQPGPLPLAVLITLKTQGPNPEGTAAAREGDKKTFKGQIALFGDSDFASNGYFNLSGNGDLFLNTINYLTEEEQLIAIRPSKSAVKPLSLTSAQARVLFWVPMVLLPLLVIIAGLIVWRTRRKAR
jgi:gliding motility-associatede transport system auxiliary component